MLKKYHAVLGASLIGVGALVLPSNIASAGTLPHIEAALQTVAGNSLLVEVKGKDRYNRRLARHGRNRGNWSYGHRYRRNHHDHDSFALYVNPFMFGGYRYYNDDYDWCYGRYGYRHWRCGY